MPSKNTEEKFVLLGARSLKAQEKHSVLTIAVLWRGKKKTQTSQACVLLRSRLRLIIQRLLT